MSVPNYPQQLSTEEQNEVALDVFLHQDKMSRLCRQPVDMQIASIDLLQIQQSLENKRQLQYEHQLQIFFHVSNQDKRNTLCNQISHTISQMDTGTDTKLDKLLVNYNIMDLPRHTTHVAGPTNNDESTSMEPPSKNEYNLRHELEFNERSGLSVMGMFVV